MRRRRKSAPSPTEPVALITQARPARHRGSLNMRLLGVHDALAKKKQLSKDYRPGAVAVPGGVAAGSPATPRKPPRTVSYAAASWNQLEEQAREALDHYRLTGDRQPITNLLRRLVGQRYRSELSAMFARYGTIRYDGTELRFQPRRGARSRADLSPARV